jgi:hypothetical protein
MAALNTCVICGETTYHCIDDLEKPVCFDCYWETKKRLERLKDLLVIEHKRKQYQYKDIEVDHKQGKLVIKTDSKDKVAMVNVQCPVCGRTIDITEETYEVPEQEVCEDCFLRLTLQKRNK